LYIGIPLPQRHSSAIFGDTANTRNPAFGTGSYVWFVCPLLAMFAVHFH
jgi:hypothetical protein